MEWNKVRGLNRPILARYACDSRNTLASPSPILIVSYFILFHFISSHFISFLKVCPMSSGTSTAAISTEQIDKFLTKISKKSEQLQTHGITLDDRELLKNGRLNLIWAERDEKFEGQTQSATTWRRGRSRRLYGEIQDADNHMFLAFILAIPPTECAKTCFNDTIESLTRLESYESYRLNLDPAAKKFFESTAAELGFTGSRRYLSFMQALFPQRRISLLS